MNFEQPVSFQLDRIGKNDREKSYSFDLGNQWLKYKNKSKTHPVYEQISIHLTSHMQSIILQQYTHA